MDDIIKIDDDDDDADDIVHFYLAMLRIERGNAAVSHLSVCSSVTFRCRDHIGWNISKVISRLISLRYLLTLIPKWVICSNENNENASKINVELGCRH